MVRGHYFWPYLEMCPEQSDLLPLRLNKETVSGEISLQVALMDMVIKFGTIDQGTLYEQFCSVFQLTGDIVES